MEKFIKEHLGDSLWIMEKVRLSSSSVLHQQSQSITHLHSTELLYSWWFFYLYHINSHILWLISSWQRLYLFVIIYDRWTSLSLCGSCRSNRTCNVTYSLWKVCITSTVALYYLSALNSAYIIIIIIYITSTVTWYYLSLLNSTYIIIIICFTKSSVTFYNSSLLSIAY